ncbi:MAG: hypothetical protein HUU41_22325 [Bryobacteraceae bacterium]|nr:hypothetical protein [Bryobacterales bacterium]MEB2362889.1 hypothetical protein [Bryobacterales bacterium]NUN03854.1 hypothetical protein [Bryobacteraceae bacterium]
MRLLILLAISVPFICAARDGSGQRETESRKAAPRASVTVHKAEPLTIPPDAKQVGDNTYLHTDSNGKAWTYTRTPFGLRKAEGTPESTAKTQDALPEMTATEEGDSVRFTRKTPFGKSQWTRKKSELTGVERAVWERDCPPKPAADQPDKAAPGSVKE